MRVRLWIGGAAIVVVALAAGCAPGPDANAGAAPSSGEARAAAATGGPSPSAATASGHGSFEAPAWFEELTASVAQNNAKVVKCASGRGADVRLVDGNIVVSAKEGAETTVNSILDACQHEVTGPAADKDLDYWRQAYDRLLDIKRCYESQGYLIADPPARDAWANAMLAGQAMPWNPAVSLAQANVSSDDIAQCPLSALLQSWSQ